MTESFPLVRLDTQLIKQIEDSIFCAVNKRVEEETRIAIDAAKKRVEERIPEIVSGVCLALQRNFTATNYGTDLVIKCLLFDKCNGG